MFRRGWEIFAENRLALVGLGFVIFILLFCFVGPLIYKTQQVSVQPGERVLHAERPAPAGMRRAGLRHRGQAHVRRADLA